MDKLIESMNDNIKELEAQYREEPDPAIKEMIDKQMTTIKERKLRLLAGKIVGEQLRNNKAIDSQNAQKVIFISKMLTTVTPKSIVMDEMMYSITRDNSFNFSLKGEISGSKGAATKIFDKYVKDLRDQALIKRVIVKDQKALPKSNIIFTIDLRL